MKIRSIAFAALAGSLVLAASGASAADAGLKTVAELYKNKEALAGQTISAQGKVVKVNNGIRGRNFVHVQDGTGEAASGNNNLVVTSKQTAKVGDEVTVSGTVGVNVSMGMGYDYPLLIEEASIAPKQ